MSYFVDTSALLAVIDVDDRNHKRAKKLWSKLISSEEVLICTNYILVETFALVQHRFGIKAVRVLVDDIIPVFTVEWVDEPIHKAAVGGLLAATRRKLSLVDCTSFEVMRRLGVHEVFVFDPHFKEQGFTCIP